MTMTPKLPASDGTEQPERMPAALAPGYFAVDELPLEARVAMSASLGASLRFLAEPEAAPRRRLLADETSGDESRLAVELDFELLVAESAGLAWPPDGAARAASSTGVHEAGNWGELFCTDEALLLARLIAIDLAAWQGAYLRGLESLPTERLAQQIVLMASALDNWYRSLRVIKQPAATALADR
ncbi:MAG TPA: hypothetical protein VFL64_09455, partial [Rhizobacter sp.]|nr:hypothetical protein [Rhizobacter sp.]